MPFVWHTRMQEHLLTGNTKITDRENRDLAHTDKQNTHFVWQETKTESYDQM